MITLNWQLLSSMSGGGFYAMIWRDEANGCQMERTGGQDVYRMDGSGREFRTEAELIAALMARQTPRPYLVATRTREARP